MDFRAAAFCARKSFSRSIRATSSVTLEGSGWSPYVETIGCMSYLPGAAGVKAARYTPQPPGAGCMATRCILPEASVTRSETVASCSGYPSVPRQKASIWAVSPTLHSSRSSDRRARGSPSVNCFFTIHRIAWAQKR